MTEMHDAYQQFMDLDFSTLCDEHAVSQLGVFCDLSFYLQKEEGFRKVISVYDVLVKKVAITTQIIDLHYYAANAWADLRKIRRAGNDDSWDWEQEEIEKGIILIRKAAKLVSEYSESPPLPIERKCQIFTNLGNQLNEIGRYIEAIEYWDKVILEVPNFGMVLGNKGFGLSIYARELYDKGHAILFYQFAYAFLNKSEQVNDPNVYEEAKAIFKRRTDEIVGFLGESNLSTKLDLSGFSLGNTANEIAYRKWCLANTLFLNPLNDLGNYSIASTDVIHVPDLITSHGKGPDLQAFFNQLKQEYSFSRYCFHEGLTMDSPHYADRDVMLYVLPQNITYSIAIEKIKSSFRTSYSLLDKIAYFLNYYFNLNVDERRINFRTIWYKGQQKKNGLRDEFKKRPNLSLRALFWLSKDLFEDKDDFCEAIEPEAKLINVIRNCIEHKYLKVQSDDDYDLFYEETYGFELSKKQFLFITRQDLEGKTLKLLKLARAAIIYLSLAIETEERINRNGIEDTLTLQIKLGILRDSEKK
jgi:tetratricopeptide (TPR) repeat protein